MRIGVHAGTLRGLGSAALGQRWVEALSAADTSSEFWVWVPAEWRFAPARGEAAARVHCFSTRPGIGRKLLTENVQIRRLARRTPFDALLSLGDTSLPHCPCPHVLFVQQAYLAYAPAEWGFVPPFRFRQRVRLMAAYLRAALPTVTLLTVQTEHMRERLAARYGIHPGRIAVIPGALDLDGPEDVPDRAPPGPPTICYLASPSVHKNHRVLAEVVGSLAGAYPDLRCRLTVRAPEVPDLLSAARRRGVMQHFAFEGALPRIEALRLLQSSHALVMPSRLESLGLPLLEAMALGCPVVAADRPYAREACGEAALYADPDDGAALATQVRRILDSTELARGLAVRGRARHAERGWSWARVGRTTLELLERASRGPKRNA